MNQKLIKIFFVVALLLTGSMGFANGQIPHRHKGNFLKALTKAIEQQAIAARKAYENNPLQIVAYWERFDVTVGKGRLRPGMGGLRPVRVRKPWTAENIITMCDGIIKEGKIFVARSCYYPSKNSKQDLVHKRTTVLTQKRKLVSSSVRPIEKTSDFIIFSLPDDINHTK